MNIYCCKCEKYVTPRLTSGREIYPHRADLGEIPFWICALCGSYVGCHYKTKDRTKPLGVIPSPELRVKRVKIHRLLDPVWKNKQMSRKAVYRLLGVALGKPYHTANIRTLEEADEVIGCIESVIRAHRL